MKSPPPGTEGERSRRQRGWLVIYHYRPHPVLSSFCLKKGKESFASKREPEAPHTGEAAVINPGILQISPATRQPLLSLHFVLTPEASRDLSLAIVLVLLGEKGRSDGSAHPHPVGNYSFDNC